MVRPIAVLGTSGLAREIAQLINQCDPRQVYWNFHGYVAEKKDEIGLQLPFGKVIGTDEDFLASSFTGDLVIGIGHPNIRKKDLQSYVGLSSRFCFPNIIHPNAVFDSNHVSIGKGNVITAGCIFTCGITLGDFNLFNLHSSVGHDAVIGSYNVINPSTNISGGVAIGDLVLCGTGSQILENLSVATGSKVGAGAVVTKSVPSNMTVVGVPAKPIQTTKS
jgi:sugar O-acyltransferase (sialic acid O-acetyltransferase NeuD family)